MGEFVRDNSGPRSLGFCLAGWHVCVSFPIIVDQAWVLASHSWMLFAGEFVHNG